MSNRNLSIELHPCKDKNGQTFFVGKITSPILIDCSQGAVFLIYTSEPGAEELQIAPMDNKGKNDNDSF
jgi:hypothetical protein